MTSWKGIVIICQQYACIPGWIEHRSEVTFLYSDGYPEVKKPKPKKKENVFNLFFTNTSTEYCKSAIYLAIKTTTNVADHIKLLSNAGGMTSVKVCLYVPKF